MMKRWNGWGDDTIPSALPPTAGAFLRELVGAGTPPRDATLAQVTATVPASRLPEGVLYTPLLTTDATERVRHARGQSLPDWVALRSGSIDTFPDGVAYPMSGAETRELLRYAAECGAVVIPYGAGTSVVGHINPLPGERPILTLDMSRMNRLRRFDEAGQMATFEAGVAGPDLEAQLRALGYTLGHFPQSFEFSTLGGWVAARSSGQQSLGYGRMPQLFAGGRLEAPSGTLDLPTFPASAAGPDLREMALGSEGRLGIITEATVRVTPLPRREDFHAIFFPTWEQGVAAARRIVQARPAALSMLRLSTPVETQTTLALAGHERLINGLERLLAARGAGPDKTMLIAGFTGGEAAVHLSRAEALALARAHGGVHMGRALGRQWKKGRFRAPYLRNVLWEMGYAVDTLETAVEWTRVPALVAAIDAALRSGLQGCGERVHAFTHLSHLYPQGSSIYSTYVFRLALDPDETLDRWRKLKAAASAAIVAHGGTISHQHGVGVDHLPYLEAEKGALGLAAIRALSRSFDPQGLMNPGKLVE